MYICSNIYVPTENCKSIARGGVQMIEIIISALLGLIVGAVVSYIYTEKSE